MRRNRLALCFELTPAAADAAAGAPVVAPEWVELIPAGPDVVGRDGRRFVFDDLAQATVLRLFADRGIDLPIDWEHASQHRAPQGEDAPAAAWIKSLEIRGGALWGRVDWTARGREQIEAREYRYLSPVFDYDPETGRIVRLVCAGLTNLPNLHLQALNSEEAPMNLSALIAAALGLAAGASEEAGVTAINQLKSERDNATARAANAEKAPPLDRYVPRADYDAATTRAANAEKALRDRVEADHKVAVDTAIEAALKAGKITPATVDYHRAACSDAAGLDRFREFVGAAPAVAADTGLDKRKPDPAAATALNAEQKDAARLLGVSEADYLKALQATA